MAFRPFTKKIKETRDEPLASGFPPYLRDSVQAWLLDLFREENILLTDDENFYIVDQEFRTKLSLELRRLFPPRIKAFLAEVFDEEEVAVDVVNYCLQTKATSAQCLRLEKILEQGGSAYSVSFRLAQPWESGVGEITERVPTIVLKDSQKALEVDTWLEEAWSACYGRNPDYEKVVGRCVSVLEKLLGEKKQFNWRKSVSEPLCGRPH